MTENAATAESRSQLCQLLALGFNHPVEEFHRVLSDGSFGQALAGCKGHFTHRETRDFAEFEADYIHLFHTGRGGKPCVSLNAGAHRDIAGEQGRPEFLLQYSGWYRHFGLKTNETGDANELPDHLVCQLEFMAWLAHLESAATDQPELQPGYRRAQRDFLQRHLQPFIAILVRELQQRAGQPNSNPFYLSLASCALEAMDDMLELLGTQSADTGQIDSAADRDQIAAVNLWG